MNQTLLRIYHSLPAGARSMVATGRGAYLRYWRYNRATERLIDAALEREAWTAKQWREWRENRLEYVLHRAATKVPYYRSRWEARRRKGDRRSWSLLENWEILEKEPLRNHPEAFVAEDCRTWRMFAEHTSGTTAKPIVLWRTREVQQAWYALLEARTRYWYGISRRDRWGIFGGQLIVPVAKRRPPFWTWNAALNQLYMSSFHLAPDLIGHYLDALKEYRVRSLLGYSSALYSVAQAIVRSGRRDIKMSVVVTNAEPLSELQRKVIAKAFQCPVRETYGSAEIVGAGSECEHGRMHQWPEVGFLEVANADNALGELICTGLLNADMPLIRYRIGDRATLASNAEAVCECGRSLPQIESLEGRMDDVLVTRDGRQVGRLDPAFKGSMPLHEAQIIQESLDQVRVLYVPAPGFTGTDKTLIARMIKEYMGDVDVVMEEVAQVPRERNGKFRAVVSKVSLKQRRPQEAGLAIKSLQ